MTQLRVEHTPKSIPLTVPGLAPAPSMNRLADKILSDSGTEQNKSLSLTNIPFSSDETIRLHIGSALENVNPELAEIRYLMEGATFNTEPYIKVGVGNDAQKMQPFRAQGHDKGLTQEEFIYIVIQYYKFLLEHKIFTSRLFPNDQLACRTDTLDIQVMIPIKILRDGTVIFGEGGLFWYGDVKGHRIQNEWHKMLGIAAVHQVYDRTVIAYQQGLGLENTYSADFGNFNIQASWNLRGRITIPNILAEARAQTEVRAGYKFDLFRQDPSPQLEIVGFANADVGVSFLNAPTKDDAASYFSKDYARLAWGLEGLFRSQNNMIGLGFSQGWGTAEDKSETKIYLKFTIPVQ